MANKLAGKVQCLDVRAGYGGVLLRTNCLCVRHGVPELNLGLLWRRCNVSVANN